MKYLKSYQEITNETNRTESDIALLDAIKSRLIKMRQLKQLSLKDVGTNAGGRDFQSISRFLNSKNMNVSILFLKAVCDGMGCSLEELFKGL